MLLNAFEPERCTATGLKEEEEEEEEEEKLQKWKRGEHWANKRMIYIC